MQVINPQELELLPARTFKSKLGGVVRSATNVRENVQLLAVDALLAASTGDFDTTRVNDLIRAVHGVGGIDSTTLAAYVLQAAPNLKKGKSKEGLLKFSWAKGTSEGERTVDWDMIASIQWWQKSKVAQEKGMAALDVAARVETLIKKIEKQENLATPAALEAARKLVARLEAAEQAAIQAMEEEQQAA